MTRGQQAANAVTVALKVVLVSWVLLFLAEHFGWSLVREAGGAAV